MTDRASYQASEEITIKLNDEYKENKELINALVSDYSKRKLFKDLKY